MERGKRCKDGRGNENRKRKGHAQTRCVPESVCQTKQATQSPYSDVVYAKYGKNERRMIGSRYSAVGR
jgi:hypothetical protein